tara:strand:+ start:280 stop:585 length:306 start_codon:yes stop_codon:yes gene_type:complete
MVKSKNNQVYFNVMRKINKNPEATQRELARDLGYSLGKLNYCLQELKKKGFVKIKNFQKNPNKINYIYILTPKGIAAKTKLTINFMRKISQEYNDLRKELK